jgi:hypothetical protein
MVLYFDVFLGENFTYENKVWARLSILDACVSAQNVFLLISKTTYLNVEHSYQATLNYLLLAIALSDCLLDNFKP